MLTGPIRPRVEDHRFRACGREGGPITWQDFGPADRDCPHAWGANMTLRRSAIERIGRFDEGLGGGGPQGSGDEAEWQRRWLASGGRIRYLAAAGVDHRRAGDDARLRSLCRAARARGRASRWADERAGHAPSGARELRTLRGLPLHGPRRRCAMGPVMTLAHARAGSRRRCARRRPRAAGVEDFLSGASGNVEGTRAAARTGPRRRCATCALARRAARGDSAAPPPRAPRLRVLVLAVERRDVPTLLGPARAELRRSRHDVEVAVPSPATRGKFENLNAAARRDATSPRYDWLLVLDDDVDAAARLPRRLPRRPASEAGLQIAQPAHRLRSHAAWAVTRRRGGLTARTTSFVEIGPVTAFARDTFATLLPFPDLRMGWGLDAHWAALAAEHGWPIGIVDATPVGHTLRPAAATYPREEAIAEARALPRRRARTSRAIRSARCASTLVELRSSGRLRPLKVLVVSEFYPRADDPVLGIWAHRQALAARDAGADVRVVVLHRIVPPASTPVARCPARRSRLARHPRTLELDGLDVRYVRFASPPRWRSYGSWGAWAAPALRRALRRHAARRSRTSSSTPTTPCPRPTPLLRAGERAPLVDLRARRRRLPHGGPSRPRPRGDGARVRRRAAGARQQRRHRPRGARAGRRSHARRAPRHRAAEPRRRRAPPSRRS